MHHGQDLRSVRSRSGSGGVGKVFQDEGAAGEMGCSCMYG